MRKNDQQIPILRRIRYWNYLKNFKATIIKMFQQAIINFVGTNEKTDNLRKEINVILKTPWKV